MTRTCNFVATEELLQKQSPGSRRPHPSMKPGVMSANFQVNPAECKTAFGRWLAERISTTRRDDDMSILNLTTRQTEIDIAVADMAKRVTSNSIKNQADFDRLLAQLGSWISEKQAVATAYGDHLFQHRTVEFEWPVLGSRAAEGVESPEAYFDLCAARIRAMKPSKVAVRWTGEEPPKSFQI